MDPRVEKLKTPEKCEIFARNALARGELALADQARRKAVELRSETHEASSTVERECLKAVYAYEEVLTKKNGRRTAASRTWQMIRRHGILEAVERAVNRETDAIGYKALADMGLHDLAFEAVVLRHPEKFSAQAIAHAKQRLGEWKSVRFAESAEKPAKSIEENDDGL